jgi:hypothetical protein
MTNKEMKGIVYTRVPNGTEQSVPPALLSARALRLAHLFVWNPIPSSRVGAGRLADILVAVFERVAAVALLVGNIDVYGRRARTAFLWHLGLSGPYFLRLVYFVEVFFEKAHVLAVALDRGIGKIAYKRHETDKKVNGQVDQHHKQDTVGEAAFDLAHVQDQVECEERIGGVANSRDQANDRGPTEAHSKKTEESKVEAVGSLASFCEDGSIVLGNVGWDLLLDFLGLAWLPWVRNQLIVRVLDGSAVSANSTSDDIRWGSLTYGDETSFDLYLFISLDSILVAAYFATAVAMLGGGGGVVWWCGKGAECEVRGSGGDEGKAMKV